MAHKVRSRLVRWKNSRLMYGLLGVLIIGAAILTMSHFKSSADAQKVSDLYYLQGAVDRYFQAHDTVPENLKSLNLSKQSLKGKLSDFRYTPGEGVVEVSNYELCAVFAGSRTAGDHSTSYFGTYHKGKNCFQLDAYGDHITAGKYNGGYDTRYQGPK